MDNIYNINDDDTYCKIQEALKSDILSSADSNANNDTSGDTRDMLEHSRIMIHDPLITQTGGSALKLKAVSEDLMETRRIVADVIAKHSGKTTEEILEKTSSDCYFRAAEAIEFGLADNIITSI